MLSSCSYEWYMSFTQFSELDRVSTMTFIRPSISSNQWTLLNAWSIWEVQLIWNCQFGLPASMRYYTGMLKQSGCCFSCHNGPSCEMADLGYIFTSCEVKVNNVQTTYTIRRIGSRSLRIFAEWSQMWLPCELITGI